MKTKTLFLLLSLCLSFAFGQLNYTVIGSGVTSSADKVGSVITDTVAGADGIKFDELSYINKLVSGQNDVTVKITDPGAGNIYSESGLMIRESLNPGSPFLALYMNGNRMLRAAARYDQGGATIVKATKVIRPKNASKLWIRIEKKGQLNSLYYKYTNNGAWIWLDNVAFMPLGSYYAGLMSASGNFWPLPEQFSYKKFKVTAIPPMRTPAPVETNKLISAYPSPTEGRITIITKASAVDLRIYDAKGSEVLRDKTPGQSHSFDLSGMSSGYYFAMARDELGNITTIKFIKN